MNYHDGEINSSCSSPNNVRMIKSRRIRWARHASCMEGMRNSYKILVGRVKERPLGKYLHRLGG
jgi:hypothetical protein